MAMGQAKGRARTNAVRVSPGEAWEAETMAEVGGGEGPAAKGLGVGWESHLILRAVGGPRGRWGRGCGFHFGGHSRGGGGERWRARPLGE